MGTESENESKQFSNAIEHGDVAAVESMLKQNPEWANRSTWTPPPLHCAVLWNQSEVAETLIRHGADIEMLDPDRQTTPLRYAIMYGKSDLIPLLISHGANTGAIVENGSSAIELAEEAASGAFEQFEDLPRKEEYEKVVRVLRSVVEQ
jgi:ankyrin repeat protein